MKRLAAFAEFLKASAALIGKEAIRYDDCMKTIAIIGGGAAGLAAAVTASGSATESVQVVVYEAADRVGKTILVTGNGRCNFSNSLIDAAVYYNAPYVEQSFAALPPCEVPAFFERLGLVWHEESEGRLYPLTNKATSILEVLRFAAHNQGVVESCGCEVMAVTPVDQRFLISFVDYSTTYADAVIVACGGAVARSIMPPAYTYLNTEPVLGPLKTDTDPIKGLNNIRVRCAVSLVRHQTPQVTETGEVLFRDYGVSGIAIFNLSRFAQAGDALSINFLPHLSQEKLRAFLAGRLALMGDRSALDFLAGTLQVPVARAVLKAARLQGDRLLGAGNIEALARALESFELIVEGIGDFRQCQVRRGGFALDAFNMHTLESVADPGLFVVGEALDVDAPCGGYNLHWAWTSGILAGRAAVAACKSL